MKRVYNYIFEKILWYKNFCSNKWKRYIILTNYGLESKKFIDKYKFRAGYVFDVVDTISANHIFSEIFINECYFLKKTNKKLLIIDIGANIGFFCIYSLIKAPNSRIISVEADPSNYKILKNNITTNNLNKKVTSINRAIFSIEGEIDFFPSNEDTGWSSVFNTRGAINSNPIKIKTTTISKLLISLEVKSVDFLKIDIEGSEYDVLINDMFLDNFQIKNLFIEVDRYPRDKRFSYDQLVDYLNNYYDNISISGNSSDYPLIVCKGYKKN